MIVVLIVLVVSIVLLIALRRRKMRKRTLLGLEALLKAFNNPFENSIKQAKERFLIEDYNVVIAITDQILGTQPKNQEALLLRALSLEAINYNLESIEDLELLNTIKEIDANNTAILGLTYKKIGEFERGQEYLKKSIEKGSYTYEAIYNANNRASPLAIELYKSKTRVPENLLRRKKSEFIKYLKEAEKNDLIEGIRKHIHNLELGIKSYPTDEMYSQLYVQSKNVLKNLEQNGN